MLDALGIAGFIFTAAFTWYAATREHTVGQSPRSALLEAWANIVIGFGVNFLVNIALLPLVGAHMDSEQNFALGWAYTAISLVRSYIIRRWVNARLHAYIR